MVTLALLLACTPPDRDPPDDTDDTDAVDTDPTSDTWDTSREPPSGAVRINELLTDNEGVVTDEVGDADDFLELFNATDVAVDLTGWTVDDGGERWPLPVGTTLPPGAWLVVWCDDDGVGLHAPFKLSKDGEVVALRDAGGGLVDRVGWGTDGDLPVAGPDSANLRSPDGASTWVVGPPTPGATNTP